MPHRDVARKRVTLLCRPTDPARTAALVETDLRAAEFRMTSSDKPVARDTLAVRAATASEEASGTGLVNFGMLVTASITNPDKERDARATIVNLTSTARLRFRPVY